ncbi:MAG: type II toxin-antitoxin system PemK/MazF family toxin [Peptococcaceae bacterium]|nr:type II toxin-antitoxin system PemK/MazF family toxin [Peptococcaceae bacterium]MDH7525784.1 type II toxin-antitoxin system PemK/MazF family toxin [Peptococcaceae bacterium]
MNKETLELLQKAQRVLNWNKRKLFYSISKKHQRTWTVKRGEVCFVDLGENIGSEENSLRPCVVLQSNAYNFTSPVFTCAIISTSKLTIPDIQIEITGNYQYIDEKGNNRTLTGTIDLGQIKTIAKERIINNIGMLKDEMQEIDRKLFNVLGMTSVIVKKDNTIKSLEGKVKYLQEKLN